MLDGSEKPEFDGSMPSLTTTEIPCPATDLVVLDSHPQIDATSGFLRR
jgi:hypothetical protein